MTHMSPPGFAPDQRATCAKVPAAATRLQSQHDASACSRTRFVKSAGSRAYERASASAGQRRWITTSSEPYGLPDAGAPLVSQATIQSVLPGYLGVTGVQLEAGRDFTMDDLIAENRVSSSTDALPVSSGRAARWASGSRLARTTPRVFEIIGVTSPVRALAVRDATTPHVFAPYDQFGLVMSVFVATDRPVTSIGPAIKRTIETLDTQRPVHDLLPMRAYVDRTMGDTRFTMLIIVAFATTALVLACIGLYGTLAYVTAQRRRDFGVRMTLGASGRRVLADVVREGLLLASIGTLIGAAGAVAVGRLLRELLYGVAPLDGVTLAAVATLVGVVALLATIHPAVRAARTDPSGRAARRLKPACGGSHRRQRRSPNGVVSCLPGGSGRDADDALERATERGLRLIAQALREIRKRRLVFLQALECEVHTPARHVLHRWFADEFGEPCRKRRARHRRFASQGRHRPRAYRIAMDQRQRAADLRIAQRAQPACLRRRILLDPGADRLDDQDVGKPRHDRLAAGAQLACFGGHQAQRALQPFELR